MAISLLALDLDGTLLDSRGRISERNRIAIDNAREQGVRVALVTGRRFRDSRPVALELGLDIPLISHNGALTKHAATLQTVSVLPLPVAAARKALRVGRKAGADALLSDDHEGLGVLVYDHIRGENSAAHKYISWARRIHGDEGANAVQQVASLEDYLDHDPVHLAFSGGCEEMDQLEEILKTKLFPLARVVTPNIPEAEKLAGFAIENESDMRRAAEVIQSLGTRAVLVKGGHKQMSSGEAVDILLSESFTEFRSEYLDVGEVHGSGCTLSAAIAAGLGKGMTLEEAVRAAKKYVTDAIRALHSTPRIGHGAKPL